ncbi:MAG: phage major capsid protein [Bryobacterales bacterium]|nr:phage major capsid protein [Bryobacterales bacterium]
MARRSQLLDAERTQLERLQAEELGLDGTEESTYQDRREQIERLDSEIASLERLEDGIRQRAAGTRGGSAAPESPWSDFGEFLRAAVEAGRPGGRVDERLHHVERLGLGSDIPSEGGFAVSPQFADEIWSIATESSALASRCYSWPLGPGANGLTLPVADETSRATGSRLGGIRVYRVAERGTITESAPALDQINVKLEKLAGLCYISDELLTDSVSLGQFVRQGFADEIGFTLDDEIMRGDGVAKCLGILQSSALVTVAKESGQAASTVVYDNVLKMWSRCWGRSRRNAVWLVNQDVEPQLYSMSLVIGTGGAPVYLPSGGSSSEPFATLFGRPVIPVEQCSTLGTLGDIVLADLSQYLLVRKPAKFATSMHVRFSSDEQAFRWTMRVNGQPLWKSALTPANGSNTLSPFVALAARS